MKRVLCVALIMTTSVLFSTAVMAQDASTQMNSTSNSNVSTGAVSSAANEGNAQSITFNSPPVPTRTEQVVRAAPSMGIGSFGTSFSSDNCSNTIAGQLSVIGVGASFGKALLEENCAHLRRGFAFGQAAAFAAANHQQDMAKKAQAMVNFEFCTTDENTQAACARLGLIQMDGRDAIPAYQVEQVSVIQHQQDVEVAQQQQQQQDESHPTQVITPMPDGQLYSNTRGYYSPNGSH